ncbi:MAG: hypothetical protein UR93_C0024G0003 [Berkelbacteria bacterium GW2011_GWA2_35_9]|uniref:Uncharacterized protein n=1 Tax=Berkelbacteria bacterium GW2011_GWA2_35_9 TaxID=1618333 RepID=A0A0G0D171_9BACT|nr:MAG: hypothetical protein UR93_C0024G0003 [Berkelbacteria bacterium GW2011_GWA2_35_9]
MLNSAHLILGSAIVAKTSNPILGIFLAFLSHYVLDFIPHYDGPENDKKKDEENEIINYSALVFDIPVSLLLIIYLYLQFGLNFYIFSGALAAVLPDLMDNVVWWRNISRKLFAWKWLFKLHQSTHLVFEGKMRYIKIVGIATQILVIVASILWIGF